LNPFVSPNPPAKLVLLGLSTLYSSENTSVSSRAKIFIYTFTLKNIDAVFMGTFSEAARNFDQKMILVKNRNFGQIWTKIVISVKKVLKVEILMKAFTQK